jgi:hypothetical protein
VGAFRRGVVESGRVMAGEMGGGAARGRTTPARRTPALITLEGVASRALRIIVLDLLSMVVVVDVEVARTAR